MEEIEVGDFIGSNYEVIRILGGGMGSVYISLDHESGKIDALKTFKDEIIYLEAAEFSLKSEAKSWIQLEAHPNIVQAYAYKEIDYRPYIILEYIEEDFLGRNTLTHYLNNSIPLEQTLLWSIQFCHGMEHALSRGITIHRDIKPDNLMIKSDGTLKVTDFGLARRTDETFMEKYVSEHGFGTIPWMAPEQIEGHPDKLSDIYSYGIVLYQMVNNGKLPFEEKTTAEFYSAHKTKDVPVLDSELFPIILRCLEKKSTKRYSSFKDLRKDLSKIYKNKFGELPPPPKKEKLEFEDIFNKAKSLFFLEKYDKAIAECKKALKKKSNDVETTGLLAECLYENNKRRAAIKTLEKTIQIAPNEASLHLLLGIMFTKEKRYEEASNEFNTALDLAKNDINKSAAYTNIGNMLKIRFERDEAIEAYNKALNLNPKNVDAYCNLGDILIEDQLYDNAISQFAQLLNINPYSAYAHFSIGKCYQHKNEYQLAYQAYKTASEYDLKKKKIATDVKSNLFDCQVILKRLCTYCGQDRERSDNICPNCGMLHSESDEQYEKWLKTPEIDLNKFHLEIQQDLVNRIAKYFIPVTKSILFVMIPYLDQVICSFSCKGKRKEKYGDTKYTYTWTTDVLITKFGIAYYNRHEHMNFIYWNKVSTLSGKIKTQGDTLRPTIGSLANMRNLETYLLPSQLLERDFSNISSLLHRNFNIFIKDIKKYAKNIDLIKEEIIKGNVSELINNVRIISDCVSAKKALEIIEKTAELMPRSVVEAKKLLYFKHYLHYSLANYQEALNTLYEILQLDSNDSMAQNQKIKMEFLIKYYENPLKNRKSAAAIYKTVDVLIEKEKYEKAIKLLDKVIALNPYYPKYWSSKSFAFFANGHPELAKKLMEESLQYEPPEGIKKDFEFTRFGLSASIWHKSIEKRRWKRHREETSDFYNKYLFKYQYL